MASPDVLSTQEPTLTLQIIPVGCVGITRKNIRKKKTVNGATFFCMTPTPNYAFFFRSNHCHSKQANILPLLLV